MLRQYDNNENNRVKITITFCEGKENIIKNSGKSCAGRERIVREVIIRLKNNRARGCSSVVERSLCM